MTPELLEYLLRLTVIWAVLLAYYGLALRRASFAFRRYFLLGGWLFGLLVPLLPSLTGATEFPVPDLPRVQLEALAVAPRPVTEVVASGGSWVDILPYLYLAGVLFFAAWALVQAWGLWQWARSGHRDQHEGYPTIRHADVRSPFVAWGCIFLPGEITDAALTDTALLHETAHLRARHHYDNTLLTIGGILCWFHPLTWVFRRLLSVVHEYQADAAVLRQVPPRVYGRQLLQAALGPKPRMGLFSSPLKKRIEMITHNRKQRKLRLFPTLGLCLLFLGLVVACSDAGEMATPNDPSAATEVVTGENLTYSYPSEDLIKAIYQEIRYPFSARNAGSTGKFDAMIFVAEDGSLAGVNLSEPAQNPGTQQVELVITGYGQDTGGKRASGNEQIFLDEIDRTLRAIQQYPVAMDNAEPTAAAYSLRFNFLLED